ncbi:unnamed protein product, partial [Ectocarpus sp. 4 AP-2014]
LHGPLLQALQRGRAGAGVLHRDWPLPVLLRSLRGLPLPESVRWPD